MADELYAALVNGGYSFWDHIYPLFLSRDITRHDMRELIRKGLSTTRGNYRALLKLFGMSNPDYKRFLNFLAAHDCDRAIGQHRPRVDVIQWVDQLPGPVGAAGCHFPLVPCGEGVVPAHDSVGTCDRYERAATVADLTAHEHLARSVRSPVAVTVTPAGIAIAS